jgi:glycine C-acetyltransferase
MSLEKLNAGLVRDVDRLREEGRAKLPERVIVDYVPPAEGRGPRYRLADSSGEYLRMNSNSYLSLSHDARLVNAADEATHRYGVGPGAVRFIDGTFEPHVRLESDVARFMGKPAAKIFNSAYTANLGLALAVQNDRTYWIGDELNHNCIIRAMRIANVPRENKAIYPHNDMEALRLSLDQIPDGIERVVVIFDGIFSMRGDHAPLDEIDALVRPHRERFAEGLITVVDDSHGVGAYGQTGRGTEEYCRTKADVVVGTFGKAFGVNGGFIASSLELVEAVRQKADTYIYTNPLSAADCAAASAALEIVGSDEGKERLRGLHERVQQFRLGLQGLGMESIPGPHPVVPLLVRETERTQRMVRNLFENEILAIGLSFPVVPRGSETIRFQINAAHTEADIESVLSVLGHFAG